MAHDVAGSGSVTLPPPTGDGDDHTSTFRASDHSAAEEGPGSARSSMQGIQFGDQGHQNNFLGPTAFYLYPEGERVAEAKDADTEPTVRPPALDVWTVKPAVIAGSAVAAGRLTGRVVGFLVGLLLLWILLLATSALPEWAQWAIAAPSAGVTIWRVNGVGLVITCATVWVRPLRSPVERSHPVVVSRMPAGVWFCREEEYQNARTMRRLLAEEKRNQERTEAAACREQQVARSIQEKIRLEDLNRRRTGRTSTRASSRTRGSGARSIQQTARPTTPVAPTKHRPTVTMPAFKLAVVIRPAKDGTHRIALHDGEVLSVADDEILRARSAPRPVPLSPGRRRIAETVRDLVEFVAAYQGREGSLRVPQTASLPLKGPAGSEAEWECHQAIKLARQWGLLRIHRVGIYRLLRDIGRTLIGFDTPLNEVSVTMEMTLAGWMWMEAMKNS